MYKHSFGGSWTEEKLGRLDAYIKAYLTALKNKHFELIYLDAFAGTGAVDRDHGDAATEMLFTDVAAVEKQEYIDGSALIALQQENPFNKYIFIESNRNRVKTLKKRVQVYVDHGLKIEVLNQKCGEFLEQFCRQDWSSRRALVFLDPYGMQVDWKVLEMLAETQAIDLMILIPYGMGANRLLVRDVSTMDPSWADRLDSFFGTHEWREACYSESVQGELFDEPSTQKVWNIDDVLKFYIGRMEKIFAYVHPKPYILTAPGNKKLFALGFASANPSLRATNLAKKLASSIMK